MTIAFLSSSQEAFELINNCDGSTRESKILAAVESGQKWNAPTFVPVVVGDITNTLEFYVSQDYFGFGTLGISFFRMPTTPVTAQKIADKIGCILPTRKMVNLIYQKCNIKLLPKTYAPKQGEPGRTSSLAYKSINTKIEEQLKGKVVDSNSLLAGHKKDVVISKALETKHDVVSIYGWFMSNGQAIQPLYSGHGNFYVDYSHGIRFVKNICKLNGVEKDITEILKDPVLSHLISDEGPLFTTRYKV